MRRSIELRLRGGGAEQAVAVPVEGGVVPAAAIRQLLVRGADGEHGLRLFDPGFANTVVCRSRICAVDVAHGTIRYRGYLLDDLVAHSSFLEVAFLLLHGELPTRDQLAFFTSRVMHHTFVHNDELRQLETFRYDAHPMGMLVATIAALSVSHPDANPAAVGPGVYRTPEARNKQIYRLLGKLPTLAACIFRHHIGRPFNTPDSSLGYTENLLYMMDRLSDVIYRPDARISRALDRLFIILAEHGAATSTIGFRHLASAGTDPYTAVSGALGCLYGERRSNAVMHLLERIGSVDHVAALVDGVSADRTAELVGFGHVVYAHRQDPRSAMVKQILLEMIDLLGQDRLVTIGFRLEEAVLQRVELLERVHLQLDVGLGEEADDAGGAAEGERGHPG
eukprot:Unigene6673_Nuclearia_a/m.20480 Unigene6673_Nuclearia_a/g.20480  ORF Unigene6673_Nuclearia_a/g.20480 Unigene6673_Nuclearia_a/m.20480 type:complete len:394 (+) Unigene6673_Nuclearia_a:38-1219(+)